MFKSLSDGGKLLSAMSKYPSFKDNDEALTIFILFAYLFNLKNAGVIN